MKRGLLLSGGVDSTALAWWRRPSIAYTIDYGHSAAEAEVAFASQLCRQLGCVHNVIRLDLAALGCGPLAGRKPSKLSRNPEWWPFRNQLLLTIAGMHAVQHGVRQLMIGTVSSDSRHADGKPAFIRGISEVTAAQEGHLIIAAPALAMDSVQLIRKSKLPTRLLLATHSCHRGNTHCGQCPGCAKRLVIFERLGLTD